jgi:hypothetical protein
MATKKFTFAGLDEAQITEMIRHECGHVIVGRCLGFPPGGIILNEGGAGADSEHHLSFGSLHDMIEFIGKRIQVLYAGAISQSLDNNDRVQPELAKRFLQTNAKDDFNKIRELLRLFVGATQPGLTNDDFAKQLENTTRDLSLASAAIIEANVPLIKTIIADFIRNLQGAATISRIPLRTHTLSRTRIDALIVATPIINPNASTPGI